MQPTYATMNYVILLFALIVMATGFATAPPITSAEFLAEHIGYMLRVTARLAFAVLLLAYVARPMAELLRSRRVLMRHRRYLGLAVALVMTVHFG